MGRITAKVSVANALNQSRQLTTHAMVDTGAAYLTLPLAWKEDLGDFEKDDSIDLELADQSTTTGSLCGPVRIEIDRFPPFYGEVLFVDMQPVGDRFEPLLGYMPLEGARVAVDMLGHRLVPLKYVDLK